jgi:hypothetical protein
MKAARQKKVEVRLQAAETELCDMLKRLLPKTAVSGNMPFFNSEYLPDSVRPHWLPHESRALLMLAKQCVQLRETIGVEINGSVGQLYFLACQEAANMNDDHGRGPRRLAACLLRELPAI